MKFKFDQKGIKQYNKLLERRVNEVKKKYIEILSYNLYSLTPKATGAMASNYNICVNTIYHSWDPDKVTPSFSIPSFSLKDNVYITNDCPYLNYVNYGTNKQIAQNFLQAAIFKSKVELNDYIKIIGERDY